MKPTIDKIGIGPPAFETLLEADRLLSRLGSVGAAGLSNAELLSLLIAETTEDPPLQNAVPVEQVLARGGAFSFLAQSRLQELQAVTGLSTEQAARIVAAGEFGRRVSREGYARVSVAGPEMVCQLLMPEYRGMTRESVRVLLLDAKAQLLRIEEVSLGSLDQSIACPREVFRSAILHSAHSIILTHNHPSGDPRPSNADRQLTQTLVEAGKILGIALNDHIIIGAVQADQPSYYSFKEEGKIA